MVKIGIIGGGKWGMNHLRVFSEIDCDLVGLADKDESKKELAEKYNTNFFTDFQKMLPLVDAVTVVVPTNLHYNIVKTCLEAGKHVLVEKPITLNSEEAKELVDLAEQKKLILSVGYLFRFNAAVKELKKILETAGEVQYITGRYIHSTKPPRTDSGAIFNLTIHLIDVLNFILKEKPKKVYCKKGNYLSEKFEDSAVMILDYGKFLANLEVSCCHPLKKRDLWIIAAKEKIYVDLLDQILIRYPLTVTYEQVEAKKEINVEINKNEPLKDELRHFCEVVEKYDEDSYNNVINIGKEEYYTTKLCELALKSAEFNRDLDLR
ncbi:Gfo/Idh/MocA family protein [Nanoarchaeota archaeon]